MAESALPVENLVILGSGPAGLTAALYAARAQLTPLLLHGDTPGGQLTTTSEVENYPGFAKGVDGNALIDAMTEQAERFGTRMRLGVVDRVDFSSRPLKLFMKDKQVATRAVIIATGARPRKLGLPSEDYYWSKGVTSCATCDGFFYKGKEVLVVGGGDSAMEEALYLTQLCSKVYIVHRRSAFRASKIMADRVQAHEKVHIIWDSAVMEVLGDGKKVTAVRVVHVGSGAVSDVPVSALFLGIGHIPNTDVFKGSLPMDDEGYLAARPDSSVSEVPGVFIAGDCHDRKYRQAVTAAGMGCMAALDAERYLLETEA